MTIDTYPALEAKTDAAAVLDFAVRAADEAAGLQDLGGGYWLRLRDGELIDHEETLDRPRRVVARPLFTRPASFAAYVAHHRKPATSLWYDVRSGAHVAFIDGDEDLAASGGPGWRTHSARLELETTEPWNRWRKSAGVWLSQGEFAELLEVAALGDPPEVVAPGAAELATLVGTLEATVSATVRTADISDGGNRTIAYEESSKVRAGKSGVELPRALELALAPFEGVDFAVRLTARLAVKAEQGKTPAFLYRILRLDQAVAAAVAKVTAEVLAVNEGLAAYAGQP